MRFILTLLASLFATIAAAQQLPAPQFRAPADNDNSPRAATTGWVRGNARAGTWAQSGAGAAQRTIEAKLRDAIDVRDFDGADPTGVLDSTGAFMAAIAEAAARGGGTVSYCGQFRVSAITVTSGNIFLRGCGYAAATLLQTASTGDTVSFGTGTVCCTVQNVGISLTKIRPAAGVTRTGGAAIRCRATFKCQVADNMLENQYIGFENFSAQAGRAEFNYILSTVTASGSKSIWVHGLGPGGNNSVGNHYFGNKIASSTKPDYGIFIGCGTQGEYFVNNDVANAYKNGWVTTACGNSDPAAPVTQMFFQTNAWDVTARIGASCTGPESANVPFGIRTEGAAEITRFNIVGDWYASSLCGAGLSVISDQGAIDTLRFSSIQSLNNYAQGVFLLNAGSTLSNIDVVAPQIFGNSIQGAGVSHGIDVYPGVTHLNIQGGRVRPAYGISNLMGYGIVLQAGASDYIMIQGVDVSGNASGGILNNSTGTHNLIGGNLQ